MHAFTLLFTRLDRTTKTLEKIRYLLDYFDQADPADAAWSLFYLTGRKLPRMVNTRILREAVAEVAELPLWLVEECYDVVGDLAETVALLHPETDTYSRLPLHRVIDENLKPLRALEEEEKKARLKEIWSTLSRDERFVWNKLITGGFRALAEKAGVEPAVIAHRLMGDWEPSAAWWEELLQGEGEDDPGKPYPFYLASPLEQSPQELGPVSDWQVEWKWDGIRAQVIKRQGTVMIWSRGEEVITDRFPEVVEALAALPEGTVLDGELLGWKEDRPLPFLDLQRRIGRKTVGKKLLAEVPVVLIAYDVLEADGTDIRSLELGGRREKLDALVSEVGSAHVRLSPLVELQSWEQCARLRETSRERRVEGVMIKRVDSPYLAGRKRGDWWKWKVDPFEVDAVLTYAQKGHGRRAGLFTDYTFGLWKEGELVTFAKAYSGLTDAEIQEVDRYVKANTLERFGPVRQVKPELVFQLACEGIQKSSRHKSGVAVRFPRIARWRKDKKPEEANRLEDLLRWIP